MTIQPYLFFAGNCEAALDFYKSVFGATNFEVMRFKDAPEPPPPGMIPDDWGDKIMHACFKIGDSVVMASDGCGTEATGHHGFQLSAQVKDAEESRRVFDALADGGQVAMPLGQTFFSPSFGMVKDRFGVPWAVVTPPGQPN